MNRDQARVAAELERAERHLAEALAILAQLRADLGPAAQPATVPRAMDYLDTLTLAQRFRLTRGHIVRLCQEGQDAGIVGIEQRGRPWFATAAAIEQVQALKRGR